MYICIQQHGQCKGQEPLLNSCKAEKCFLKEQKSVIKQKINE